MRNTLTFRLLGLAMLLFVFGLAPSAAQAQQARIKGTIFEKNGGPIPFVNVFIDSLRIGTTTNVRGSFTLAVPPGRHTLKVTHVEYKTQTFTLTLGYNQERTLTIRLEPDTRVLGDVEVTGSQDVAIREQSSITRIDPENARFVPAPFQDISSLLRSQVGVISNNELSTTYSVRGGNYEENLVYVNGMEVYRPFLVRAGQQEGLSFVNTDLVESVEFSTGGWQPKYGDKLSSVLAIEYKRPTETAGSASLGVLGGSAHVETASADKRIRFVGGVRRKDSRLLLNAGETKGLYLPRFMDVQTYLTVALGKATDQNGEPKTTLGILNTYANNRYFLEPSLRETDFGTFTNVRRLRVDFAGHELMQYDTYQGGLQLEHKLSDRFSTRVSSSVMTTREREFIDLEGGYLLCDVNNDPNTSDFNECEVTLGLGTEYRYARNQLRAFIMNSEVQNTFTINSRHRMEFGVGHSYQAINDVLDEWMFTDSAGYVRIDSKLEADLALTSHRLWGYWQNTEVYDERQTLSYGLRVNWWSISNQWLFSPRFQYSLKPNWASDVQFTAAFGLYQQPPFYRELRDFEGNLNLDLKAQSSVHAIIGMDYDFSMWGRPFKWLNELYYKYLWNVIPYDVDNVRLRYYATNNATAYARGLDTRLSGEFIPGTESWVSLGILNTEEDWIDDDRGPYRRPTDQRVTLGLFLQDQMPFDPTLRAYLGVQYGTGLPFGPPNLVEYRQQWTGAQYRRVDVGFSKSLIFNEEGSRRFKGLKSLWAGLDILNLLGADNDISYTWIRDVNNDVIGVPNALSARFFNLRVIAKF